MVRTLQSPPSSVVTRDGNIQSGSFSGALPRVDLSPLGKNIVYRLTHQKRWVYVAIASDDLFCGLAVVDLGYVKSTFGFAYARDGGMLADKSAIGHPVSGGVANGIDSGLCANFSAGRTRVEIVRRGNELEIDAAFFPDLEIRARLDANVKHPPLSAIGPVPGGIIDATEKHALLPVTGDVVVRGERRSLKGAVGGWDYTHGYLARHTQWRWGYLLGRTTSGERIGMNLVEGFLGECECGVWIDDVLHPVGEGRFSFNKDSPLDPWTITSSDGALDLRFEPGGMHAEKNDFKVVRSSFLQPVGTYSGTIRVGGRTLTIDRVLGVAEDQDVVW
jgi:hypothetical protein